MQYSLWLYVKLLYLDIQLNPNTMKKQLTIFAIALTLMFSVGCKKSDQDAPLPDEDAIIRNYLSSISSDAVKHSSGVYYKIMAPGAGDPVVYTSDVTVNYKGSLLNGSQFDDVSNKSIKFINAMQGWQVGINMIRPGGRIKLYVPSSLGYGKYVPKPEVPANSILVYDLELVSQTKVVK
jgi:FKBP-type peptidyl-prolyl cis-trans isomerase FkpA